MFNGASILLTGGTGSFGKAFIRRTLEKYSPKKIIIYSRDEMKQWEMAKQFQNDPRLRFFIGDVRDKDRLGRACEGVDVLIHAAALKIVPSAEYNPFECIKTNVTGAMNVIDCALDHKIKRVVALSTDKACNPINLYGATKLCSDKLFVSGNAYVQAGQDTRFCVVRYGNVMGSRGSVIPLFRSISSTGELLITDERMTRFMITLDQAVDLVWFATEDCSGGEIYVKKIPSMKVVDVAKTIAPQAKLTLVGIRPGEKLHEQMISVEDARTTLEFDGHYTILPQIDFLDNRYERYQAARHCPEGFSYSSETNTEWMKPSDLKDWMSAEYGDPKESAPGKAVTVPFSPKDFFQTLIIEVADAFPNVEDGIRMLRSAIANLEEDKDSQALEVLNRLLDTTKQVPELYLAKAVAEVRLGKNQDAFCSVLRLLEQRPEHSQGRKFLSNIGEALGAHQILDFS